MMKVRLNLPNEVESGLANKHGHLQSQATTQFLMSMVIMTRP